MNNGAMARWSWLWLVAWLAWLPLEGYAHTPMAHACTAPVRPIDDQDDLLWHVFLEEIEVFQACVNEASDRHLAAAREHQAAARAAVDSWNAFVRNSLNAPEDYPWPPEDGS
jgi:hypothetical protein